MIIICRPNVLFKNIYIYFHDKIIIKMAGRGHDRGSTTSYVERTTFISRGHAFNARTCVTIATLDIQKLILRIHIYFFLFNKAQN